MINTHKTYIYNQNENEQSKTKDLAKLIIQILINLEYNKYKNI